MIVTSTAAVAAERLAADLAAVGVEAPAYSTVALQHAIETGRVEVDARHDRDPRRGRARIDPRAAAAPANGRGSLGAPDHRRRPAAVKADRRRRTVATARAAGRRQASRVELTTNLRALDPDDQRDQRRFRDGQHREALEGYAARERLHRTPTRRRAEAGRARGCARATAPTASARS